MTKVEQLKKNMTASGAASEAQYKNMLRINKYPAVEAYQRGEIDAKQYEEAVGETYLDTIKDIYAADLEALKETMATRVKCDLITEEDYKSITGDEYNVSGAAG